MKILVIPDIHEKDVWKERVNANDYDKVIFLGDYVDSWTHDDKQAISNLQDIIAFKQSMGDKCILLLGNHDVQYMFFPHYNTNGLQQSCAAVLKLLFQLNKDLFKIAHLEGNHLFTHAGVAQEWFNKYDDIILKHMAPGMTIADAIESIFNSSDSEIIFDIGPISEGNHDVGGPLWFRPLEGRALKGFHHIVGHTRMSEIKTVHENDTTSITYTDVLDTIKQFLLLDINRGIEQSGSSLGS